MAGQARRGLDGDDIATVRAALADGGKPTVWFTAAAVGVKAGSSAKVLELTEPAEGDFIRVKPAGSSDELSFGATELTLTRPSRTTKKAAAPARSPAPRNTVPEPKPPAPAPEPAATAPAPKPQAPKPQAPKPQAPKPQRRTGPRPAPITTVTVTSTEDGEWKVDVHSGKKRTIRGLNVPASSVLAAAKSLGDEVAGAIDTAISEARQRQQAEVERLRERLAEAERTLDDLSG